MISITVVRDSADILGEDIVDTLITTEGVATQRGRNAIDSNAKITPVSLTVVHRTGLETGQVIQVMDSLQGRTWRAKIIGLDIALEFPALVSTLYVERV